MSAMEHSRIKRVVLKREDFEIEIERECMQAAVALAPSVAAVHPSALPSSTPQLSVLPVAKEVAKEEEGLFVTSPMVGTFYTSPSPENPPFVKIGDQITEETVVCIVEAMKVMNEVKAGVKGLVSEILLKNGEPVEFGTRMFKIQNP